MNTSVVYLSPDHNTASNSASGAFVDWLSVTIRVEPLSCVETGTVTPWFVQFFSHHLSKNLDIPLHHFSVSEKGWMGYTSRLLIGDRGCYGFVAFGGKSQNGTASIQLTGAMCRRIQSWDGFSNFCIQYSGKITRVDVAYDDFESCHYSLADCIQIFKDGGFVAGTGRPSAGSLVDDLGSGKGSTLYIGSRKSGKYCRIYEKGKQLGDSASAWVRYEVEYRAKDRVIGWDVLAFPGDYLSGAYKPFSVLSDKQSVVKTVKKIRKLSLHSAQKWLKHAAGGTIHTLLYRMYDGDISALIFDAIRPVVPRRLQYSLA